MNTAIILILHGVEQYSSSEAGLGFKSRSFQLQSPNASPCTQYLDSDLHLNLSRVTSGNLLDLSVYSLEVHYPYLNFCDA